METKLHHLKNIKLLIKMFNKEAGSILLLYLVSNLDNTTYGIRIEREDGELLSCDDFYSIFAEDDIEFDLFNLIEKRIKILNKTEIKLK